MRIGSFLIALSAALFIATGCGDDDVQAPPAPTSPPEAETGATGAAGAPGAPDPGEPSYAALGTYWSELPIEEREASAAEFIDDNPEACAGIAPEDLSRQAGVAYGIDFTLTTEVGDVMLETCALLRDGQ